MKKIVYEGYSQGIYTKNNLKNYIPSLDNKIERLFEEDKINTEEFTGVYYSHLYYITITLAYKFNGDELGYTHKTILSLFGEEEKIDIVERIILNAARNFRPKSLKSR